MPALNQQPIYDPAKTWEDNFEHGPFGGFENAKPYQNSGEPKHSFLGFPLYEPFGMPAGPLPTSRHVTGALAKGFDFVVYKTQRSVPFAVNAFPNILYLDIDGDLTLEKAKKPLVGSMKPPRSLDNLSITNSFGNPSRGPEFWVPDVKKAISAAGKGQLVIVNVVGTIQPGFSTDNYYDDFATAAKLAASTGTKAVEINLSCPNVANEGILCYTPSAVDAITSRVKEAIGGLPLIVKLGYYAPEQDALLNTVLAKMAPYVAAVSAINTIPAPVVDENGQQALPGPNRLSSGICGASIKWAGLDMTSRLAAARKKNGYKYEIIGVGGVMTPADYSQYRAAGADAVQSATGAMWDTDLAIKIKEGNKGATVGAV